MSTTVYGPSDSPFVATTVSSASPNLRGDGLTAVALQSGACVALWNTAFPGLPLAASISAATLTVMLAADVDSATLSVSLNEAGFDTTTTWATMPAATGTAVTTAISDASAGDIVTVDVTTLVSGLVAAGASNGVQITTSDTDDVVSIDQTQTALSVDWTVGGDKASGLAPYGVVGVSKPTLSGFPKDTQKVRVSIDTSLGDWQSPDWQSGTIDVDAPELDLSTTDYPGAGIAKEYWITSWLGQSGGWSEYSDPIWFQFVALPTLLITGPNDAYPYVTDPSPTITWSVTGGTQKKARVFVSRVDGGDRDIIYDTGQMVTTAQQWTIPAKDSLGRPIFKDRNQYRVWVRVWDDKDRVAVPGAQVYAQDAQVFTFVETQAVQPVDWTTADQVSTSPQVEIEWGRLAGVPDHWMIWRDDTVLDVVDPSDVDDPDIDGWRYVDWAPQPFVEHTYYIEPVVNGNTGPAGPKAAVTVDVKGYWIQNRDLDVSVLLWDVDWQPTATDQASSARPVGQRNTVRRTSSLGYLESALSGTIRNDPTTGRAAISFETDMHQIKASPDDTFRIHYGNKVFSATISDIAFGPDPQGVHADWTRVSMNVWEQDDLVVYGTPPPAGEAPSPDPDHLYDYSAFDDEHVLTTGDADITATAGTPTIDADAALHDGAKAWAGGSITRALPNATAGTLDAYWMVPDTLSSTGAAFTLKNPAGDNPVTIRIRTAGSIDMQGPDGTIEDTCDYEWTKGVWCRTALEWTWTPDPSLGASLGWLDVDVHTWIGTSQVENPTATDEMHARFAALQPQNYAEGSPSGGVIHEVSRQWGFPFYPYAYGTPPPAPPIPAGTALEMGGATDTDMYAAVYNGDADADAAIGLVGSTNSDMSDPFTTLDLGTRGTYGFNKTHITGLTANTVYYWQGTVDGSASGPIVRAKTQLAAGSTGIQKVAIASCQQTNPASTAAFADAVAFEPDWYIHLGDDGYPNDLWTEIGTHEKWYALAVTDPARMLIDADQSVDKVISDHDVNQNAVKSPKGNNPNLNDPVTETSLLAWADSVPVPMEDTRDPRHGRYWHKVVGNVMWIYTDTRDIDRSNTWDGRAPDDPTSTMLGAVQKAWFKALVVEAAANDYFLVVVTDPGFLGTAALKDGPGSPIMISNSDKWCAYTVERDELDTFMADTYENAGKSVDNIVILNGDTHAIQAGKTTRGIRNIVCSPWNQNSHALECFVDAYDYTFPADADAPGRQPKINCYVRVTLDNSTAGTMNVTIDARDCTPKHTGTPLSLPIPDDYASWTATL